MYPKEAGIIVGRPRLLGTDWVQVSGLDTFIHIKPLHAMNSWAVFLPPSRVGSSRHVTVSNNTTSLVSSDQKQQSREDAKVLRLCDPLRR